MLLFLCSKHYFVSLKTCCLHPKMKHMCVMLMDVIEIWSFRCYQKLSVDFEKFPYNKL